MPKPSSVLHLLRSLGAGETVFVAGSAGEPRELIGHLAGAPSLASGVRFITSFAPGINAGNLASAAGGRHMRVFFMQPAFRNDLNAGFVQFSPMSYFGIDQYLRSDDAPIDVVIVQVSEPDADGQCSLGPSVEFMPGLLGRAGRILAVINPNIPQLPGAPAINIDSFHAVARSEVELAQYAAGRSNAVTDEIAAHLVRLIPNSATLQVGLGKIPSQLLRSLTGHKDLAFHSGMLSDSIVALVEAGALRSESALTTTVVVGSESLYRNLPTLGSLRLAGVDHTHNPKVLAGIENLYAINSAFEVDLLGQVNAEVLGGQYVSGPGGLPDFAHAARRSPKGLSIIALPAADSAGERSRIVARLNAGTPVVAPQHDVDAVVTEYGVAHLRGADLEERAHRLIEVAHPVHRDRLKTESTHLLRSQ